MASVSHGLHGSPGRMQMLLAQIQAEFSGQQQQRNDDCQRQLGELHSMRQMLDTLEKRYKSETEELRTKIRSQEDAIHHLQAQLAAKEHGMSPEAPQNLVVAEPTSDKPPETTQDWTELPLESIANQNKQTGSDWYALFNPHVPRRFSIGLLHTLEHSNIVCCVRFSADARYLATASHQTAKIFDIGTGELVTTLDEHHSSTVGESFIRSISFSPDGLSLATSAEDSVIRLWDIRERKIYKLFTEHTDAVDTIEWVSNGHEIVSGSRDRTVKLWNVEQGRSSITLGAQSDISSVSVSSDMEYIIASCNNASIYVWSRRTGLLVTVLQGPDGHSESAYCVSASPSGGVFASGSLDRTVKIWRPHPLDSHGAGEATAARLEWSAQTLAGHKDYVVSVCATGHWILSGSKDRTLRLWDAHTGDLLLVLNGHKNTVLSVATGPSNYFATGAGDKMVRVWSCMEI